MELNELKSLWKNYDSKLDRAISLNLQLFESIQTKNIRSKIAPVFWKRVIELSLHLIYLLLLVIFLVKNITQIPYALSAGVLIAFYMAMMLNCIRQINIIKRMDFSEDIIGIQSGLAELQTNLINQFRTAILFTPAFLAFPVVVTEAIKDFNWTYFESFDIISQSGGNWWTAQIVATIVLIPLCIWAYKQISIKNIHKKWVNRFVKGSTSSGVKDAMEYLKELRELRGQL